MAKQTKRKGSYHRKQNIERIDRVKNENGKVHYTVEKTLTKLTPIRRKPKALRM